MTAPMTPEMLVMYYEAEALRMLSVMDDSNVTSIKHDSSTDLYYVNIALVHAMMTQLLEDTEKFAPSDEFKGGVNFASVIVSKVIALAYSHDKEIDIDSLDK